MSESLERSASVADELLSFSSRDDTGAFAPFPFPLECELKFLIQEIFGTLRPNVQGKEERVNNTAAMLNVAFPEIISS